MTTVAYLAIMNNFSVLQPTLAEELKKVRASSICLFKSFDDEMLFRNEICYHSSISVLALGFVIVGHKIHHVNIIKKKDTIL